MYSFSKMDGFINFFKKFLSFDHTHLLRVITDFFHQVSFFEEPISQNHVAMLRTCMLEIRSLDDG